MTKSSDQPTSSMRWKRLQNLALTLPEAPPPPSIPEAEPIPDTPTPAYYTHYQRLRTMLDDQRLPFRATYSQAQVAKIIGVSDRTVRNWTNAGKMTCCRYPSGRPYYTPGNIEDHLVGCERPCFGKVVK